MFNVLMFSLLAVLLVVAGVTVLNRRHHDGGPLHQTSPVPHDHEGAHHTDAERRSRKARRTQSRNARRKRH